MASNKVTLSTGFLDSRYVNITGDTMTGDLTTTVICTPTINGGILDNDDITIQGTTHATRTTSYVILQPNGGNVGIGTTEPSARLEISGRVSQIGLGYSTFFGYEAGKNDDLTNNYNTAIGYRALRSNTTGYDNSAVGMNALYSNTTASYNSAVGVNAGRYIADGVTTNQTSNNSVFLGYDTRANASGETNQIVIGATAIGAGSNSVVLGNNSITKTILKGNIGIGTMSPTNVLSFEGNAARIFWMERHTTADSVGNSLTIQAGGATVAATNKAGGQLILLPGLSTGSAESGITIRGCVAGSAGTGDNSLQDMIKVLGNKLGVFNTTPVVQQNHIADASGGTTVDAEARAAINAALLVLETYGWLKVA